MNPLAAFDATSRNTTMVAVEITLDAIFGLFGCDE